MLQAAKATYDLSWKRTGGWNSCPAPLRVADEVAHQLPMWAAEAWTQQQSAFAVGHQHQNYSLVDTITKHHSDVQGHLEFMEKTQQKHNHNF